MTSMIINSKDAKDSCDIISQAVKELKSYPTTPYELSRIICGTLRCDPFFISLIIKDAFEEMRQLDLIRGNSNIGYYLSEDT